MPGPVYWETSRRTQVYTVGELQVIQAELRNHGEEYTYLVSRYNDSVERMHQAIHAYREEFI